MSIFQDGGGRTALAHACIAEKEDILSALASVPGCDPNITDNDGNTPLMYAVRSRHPTMVQSIIEAFRGHDLDVNCVNDKGI